jgi:hypothetical protein
MRGLTSEQRLAGYAAAALAVSLLLPWYSLRTVIRGAEIDKDSLSAFGAFSFVEAAVLLVSGGTLYLLYVRSQGRPFHLPGGDGTVIFAAGVWAGLLLLWRLFDHPDGDGVAKTGVQWGIFVAFGAAASLAVAGQRLRAAHVPEPPNPAAEGDPAARRRARRRPVDPAAVTEVLRDTPTWSGDVPEPPARLRPTSEPLVDPAPAEGADPPAPEPRPGPPDRLF